jgi:predicted nucleic acid-binding Zn ribbon protein
MAMKGSSAVRIVVAAVLLLIAVYFVVAYAYRGGTPGDEVVVQCAVCGTELPRDEMMVVPAESIGAAPDQLPIYACSEACAARVRANPEKYRQKTVR